MSPVPISAPIHREPELLGQTVVVIGGSADIGFETARRARTEGANVILTGRNAERLQHAASEVDALSTAAFDAADPVALDRFFRDLPTVDHVMVTAGRPYYGRLADMDFAKIRDLMRVNLIAAGFVDTPLSAELLGDQLEKRRNQLRSTLPIGRVVGPADVAALAVHIMTNTALTGPTYDIDGGQQFVAA
jgi:NAD(P)-dependent dehydrogenase (short-subunit alcohol dehydrogenase family)